MVRNDAVGVNFQFRAESLAIRAGALRRVEGEGARLHLRDADAVFRAGEVFREMQVKGLRSSVFSLTFDFRLLTIYQIDCQIPFTKLECSLYGVGQSCTRGFLLFFIFVMCNDQAVYDGFDGVLFVAIQFDLIVQRMDGSIHAGAGEACLADLLEHGLIRPFAGAHERGENQDAHAFRELLDLVHDLLRGLLDHFPPADGTVRDAGAGEQQAEVVINFGNGTHCRTGIMRGGFLVNADGGGESFDVVHIRLVHLPDELARVRGEGFDVAALSLGEDGVERQRRLARPRQTRDDHELIAGNLDGNVLQVMHACADHADRVGRHRTP